MSNNFMHRTADVLDKLAEYIDQQETQQELAVKEAQQRTLNTLREKLEKTGADVSPEVLAKIASLNDNTVIDAVTKLAEHNTDDEPEGLGESRDIGQDDNVTSRTKVAEQHEAVEQAHDSFGNWIMS